MKSNIPQISVIMSVYKEPIEWLKLSIDSILHQTFSDLELIIVCDNPQYQEGISLLKDFEQKDTRIKILYNEENIGLTKSLNKGISLARGEYIARMDADDISLQNRFEVELQFLRDHPTVDVCGSFTRAFGKVGLFTSKVQYDRPIDSEDINVCMLFVNPIVHPTVLMKKNIAGELVQYDERYRISQDYMLWHSLIKKGAVIINLNRVLLKYRISDVQISSKSEQQRIVCHNIQADILRSLNPDVSDEDILIHDEIRIMLKSKISLEDKVNYLLNLKKILLEKFNNTSYIENIIAQYVFYNCLAYQSPFYCVKKIPSFKKNIFKKWFIRGIVKHCVSVFK